MRNWADSDSSDSELEDGHHPARLAPSGSIGNLVQLDNEDDDALSYEDEGKDYVDRLTEGDSNLELADEAIPYPPDIDFDATPPNFPTEAPFTAYIRNLSFGIKTTEELAEKVEAVVNDRYQASKRVKVTTARLGFDHHTGKRKGFGYAEFETAEELMIFLNISDGFSIIMGRPISIDIAHSKKRNNNNQNRRGGAGGGGGNYRNNDRGGRGGGGGRGGDLPDVDGSQFKGGFRSGNNHHRNNNNDDRERRNRPSLKLAPRSKPVDNSKSEERGQKAFGDSKSGENDRGGDSWRGDRNNKGGRGRGRGRGSTGGGRQNSSGRGSGRGGRGKREGRGSGRGNRHAAAAEKTEDGWDSPKGGVAKNTTTAPAAAAKTAPAVVEQKKTVAKVKNSFAGLAFDSDSD